MSIEDVIKNKISNTGFKLEMEVAGQLNLVGLHPYQSVYYKDPGTGQEREVDLVATKMTVMDDSMTLFKVSLVIQCKWSKNTAWVGFLNSIPRGATKDGIIKTLYGPDDRSYITGFSRDLESDLEILNIDPERSCYAMTSIGGIRSDKSSNHSETGGKEKDIAYEGYRSIISGSLGVLNLGMEDASVGHRRRCISIIVPIIVVDGPLCEARINNCGEIECCVTDGMTLIYNGERYFNISVVTKEEFAVRVPAIARDIEKLLNRVSVKGSKYLNHKTFAYVNRI